MTPQVELTDHEIGRLGVGNQHTDWPSVIEWQVVKGAAARYEVSDWTAVADPSLTYAENVELMRRSSTNPRAGAPTMREMPALSMEKRPGPV